MKFSTVNKSDYEEIINSTEIDTESNSEMNKFLGNVDLNEKDALVPKKPKPGELIYCQFCGNPVYPEQLSSDLETRRKEFKWHYHEDCKKKVIYQLDVRTPGLMAERRMFEKRRKQAEEDAKPKVQTKPKSMLDRLK